MSSENIQQLKSRSGFAAEVKMFVLKYKLYYIFLFGLVCLVQFLNTAISSLGTSDHCSALIKINRNPTKPCCTIHDLEPRSEIIAQFPPIELASISRYKIETCN